MTVSNARLKKFRNEVNALIDQELAIRAKMKALYTSLVAETLDEKMALRQVRQAYFQIQKYRIQRLMEDRLEFHPFFSIIPENPLAQEPDEELD